MHVMSACVLHCQFERAPDGSVVVNEQMESSCKDVFAAGDCCSIRFADDSADKASDPPDLAKDRHWFQVHPTLHASIDVLHVQSANTRWYHGMPLRCGCGLKPARLVSTVPMRWRGMCPLTDSALMCSPT